MGNKFLNLKQIKSQIKKFVPVFFVLVGLMMFFLTALNVPVMVALKTKIMEFIAPVIAVVSYPVQFVQDKSESVQAYLNVYEENKRLKAENEVLKSWQKMALKLAVDQKELARLLNYKPVAQGREYVVRVLADYNSPFSQSLIINGGENIGVQKGDVLVTNDGLLGHVIEVGTATARALKVTDFYSRLPVSIGTKKIVALMSGDNTHYPKITALPEEAVVSVGDYVMTAGDAGVYPSGIPVGRIASVKDGEISVDLFEQSEHLEFVRAVDFGLKGLLPSEKPCAVSEGK